MVEFSTACRGEHIVSGVVIILLADQCKTNEMIASVTTFVIVHISPGYSQNNRIHTNTALERNSSDRESTLRDFARARMRFLHVGGCTMEKAVSPAEHGL